MALPRALIKLVCLLLVAGPFRGEAAELELRLVRMAMPGVVVEGISVVVDWPETRGPQSLALRVDRMSVAMAGLDIGALSFDCRLVLDAPEGTLCEGPASWRDTKGAAHTARLRLVQRDEDLLAVLSLQGATMSISWPWQEGAPVVVVATEMPAQWVQPALADLWSGARLTEGTLGGSIELTWDEAGTLAAKGQVRTRGLGLDTDDGSVAAAGVGAEGALLMTMGDRLKVGVDLVIEGGEVLFDPFYAELPARPLRLALEAREEPGARWHIDNLVLSDNGVFDLRGGLILDMEAEDWLHGADLQANILQAEEALSRYVESLLGLAGMSGLRAEGALDARLRMDARGMRALEIELRDLYVADPQGRFGFDALSGAISLGPDSPQRESAMRSTGASFYRIALGALDISLRSGGDSIELAAPTTIDLLGGQVAIERMRWHRGNGEQVDFEASLDLVALDLARLTEAFEWPPFGGQLSGRIPAVSYDEGVLAFDGGLRVGVFDGRVDIDSLSMERPFGVLPTMNADIRFSGLDLQQMTQVFDFGEIEGRLRGHVLGMRLIDWEPVAFDAVLRTEKGAGPRRISQRAVESLSSVGGGGGVAALQSSVLRVFSTFGYDEIGLSCRLQNHVCHMDGIDSVGQGYAIVKGSGLPRISVVGHQRQVDWPVLLARLQAATTGAGPVMN